MCKEYPIPYLPSLSAYCQFSFLTQLLGLGQGAANSSLLHFMIAWHITLIIKRVKPHQGSEVYFPSTHWCNVTCKESRQPPLVAQSSTEIHRIENYPFYFPSRLSATDNIFISVMRQILLQAIIKYLLWLSRIKQIF